MIGAFGALQFSQGQNAVSGGDAEGVGEVVDLRLLLFVDDHGGRLFNDEIGKVRDRKSVV